MASGCKARRVERRRARLQWPAGTLTILGSASSRSCALCVRRTLGHEVSCLDHEALTMSYLPSPVFVACSAPAKFMGLISGLGILIFFASACSWSSGISAIPSASDMAYVGELLNGVSPVKCEVRAPITRSSRKQNPN